LGKVFMLLRLFAFYSQPNVERRLGIGCQDCEGCAPTEGHAHSIYIEESSGAGAVDAHPPSRVCHGFQRSVSPYPAQ
jgi:hypothetical protein